MSQLTTYHEFVLKRDGYLAQLRALENDVKQTTNRITEQKIQVGVGFNRNELFSHFRETLRDLQAMADGRPITIPITFQQLGGARSGGAMPQGMPGFVNTSAGAAKAGSSGGMFGSPVGRYSMALFIAALEVGRMADVIGTETTDFGAIRDPAEQLAAQRRVIEERASGARGVANWAYAKVGIQPSYKEEITRVNDAQREMERTDRRKKEMDAASGRRESITDTLTAQETFINQTQLGEGGFAKQRSAIVEAFRKSNEAADEVVDGWQKLHFRSAEEAKKLADRIRKDATVVRDIANAAISGKELSDRHAAQTKIEDYRTAQTAAEMRTDNRPREAAMLLRNRAAGAILGQLQRQIEAEDDPVQKRHLRDQLTAAKPAVEAEQHANLEDERRRIVQARFADEVAASRAATSSRTRDLREQLRIFDMITEEETKKIEDEEEKRSFVRRRGAERAAMQERHALDIARTFQGARDIELHTAGRGGLADEMDIEDETRRNLREAGGDPAARAAAVALGIAKARALVKGQSRPQMFNDVASFSQNLQERIFNGDADGLKRASGFLKLLEQNKGGIARGDKLPGEDDPFAAAQQFNQGANKFAGAVDKAVGAGNIIGIVRRN